MPTEYRSKDSGTNVQGMGDINATIALMQPVFDSSITEGTKQQKSSLLRYWAMYRAALRIDMHKFCPNPKGT